MCGLWNASARTSFSPADSRASFSSDAFNGFGRREAAAAARAEAQRRRRERSRGPVKTADFDRRPHEEQPPDNHETSHLCSQYFGSVRVPVRRARAGSRARRARRPVRLARRASPSLPRARRQEVARAASGREKETLPRRRVRRHGRTCRHPARPRRPPGGRGRPRGRHVRRRARRRREGVPVPPRAHARRLRRRRDARRAEPPLLDSPRRDRGVAEVARERSTCPRPKPSSS